MGFSLGEILLLVIVGIIVVGPKNLPPMMRTAGQWVARLRRMSTDLRSQSGIDDLIRQEGLTEHIRELRSLSRMNVVETLIAPAAGAAATSASTTSTGAAALRPQPAAAVAWSAREPLREREYPIAGCDAYGALPDDATPYIPPAVPPAPDPAPDPAEKPADPAPSEAALTEAAPTETVATETASTETPAADVSPAARSASDDTAKNEERA